MGMRDDKIDKLKKVDVDRGLGSSPSGSHKKKKRRRHDTLDNNVEEKDIQMEDIIAEGSAAGNTVNEDKKKKKKKKKYKYKREKGYDEKQSRGPENTNETSIDGREVHETGERLEVFNTELGESSGLQTNEQKHSMSLSESETKNGGEKNHKRKKRETLSKTDTVSSLINLCDDNTSDKLVEGHKDPEKRDIVQANGEDERARKKKKKEKKRKCEHGGNYELVKSATADEEDGTNKEYLDKSFLDTVESPGNERHKNKKEHNNVENLEKSKEDKKSKRKKELQSSDIMDEKVGGENGLAWETEAGKDLSKNNMARSKVRDNGVESEDRKAEKKNKKEKKKKAKSLKDDSRDKSGASASTTKQDDPSQKSMSSNTKKRVSFSEDVEVFPLLDKSNDDPTDKEGELVRGKRFTHKEDEMIRVAVLSYVDAHGLGEEGVKMVLNCRKHREVKDCWKEIAAALPWRPPESVYYRAHILFERDENRTWTPEELEIVRKFHKRHGADWKTLADALGKHRFHVKDAWRRIKLPNQKRGPWSQDEYQKLFDLVNIDLRLRAFEEKKSKHGMLRDNISWEAISGKLETRTNALCCMKWYEQLSSPMVAEGKWLDTDDYHLLMELYDLDACCMEDVDWDNLLEHRSGDVCRKRWNQMVKHIGEHKNKSFAEQVEVLIGRYRPDVLEAREAYNKKKPDS